MTTTSKYHHPKLAIGIAAIVASASSALATLNYDLRATALNGVPLPVAVAHGTGLVVSANDVISFTVYAQVTGTTTPSGDGFQAGLYNLIASRNVGDNQGLFQNAAILPAFATGAFNAGTISPDGSRLGGPNTKSAQTVAPFDISVRAGSTPAYNGTPILNGQEFALSTVDYKITSAGSGFSITMFPSLFTSGIGASKFSSAWAEDTAGGTASGNRSSGFNGYTPAANAANTGTITATSFAIVPEPSAFGMVIVGAMGLVGMRRLGFRRTF